MGNSEDNNENKLSYEFLYGKSKKNYYANDFFEFDDSDLNIDSDDFWLVTAHLIKKITNEVIIYINPVIVLNNQSIPAIKKSLFEIVTGEFDWSKFSVLYQKVILFADEQKGGTYYAHAISTIIHLASSRIIGRKFFEFESFRDKLIQKYGNDGACTEEVLKNELPPLRLHYEIICCEEAKSLKRPCLVRFYMDKYGWEKFSYFFKNNPKGILDKKTFDSIKCRGIDTDGWHAVVLLNYNKDRKYLFLNSWGEQWGDKGKFRLDTLEIFKKYEIFDVFYTESDLTKKEKSILNEKGKLGWYIHYSLEGIKKNRELVHRFLGFI